MRSAVGRVVRPPAKAGRPTRAAGSPRAYALGSSSAASPRQYWSPLLWSRWPSNHLAAPAAAAAEQVSPTSSPFPVAALDAPSQPTVAATTGLPDKTPVKAPVKTALAAAGTQRGPSECRRTPKGDRRWLDGLLDRPADAPAFHVVRAASAGSGPVYSSLAAAAAAAPAGRLSVVEIDDDGPLFETSTTFTDRQLLICAGKGFRPLLVWDVPRTLDEGRAKDHGKTDAGRPPAFLTIRRGGLRLENVDVAFKQPEAVAGGLTLLDLQDADLSVEGCTFSLAGTPREGTTLTRFGGERSAPRRCRFTRAAMSVARP